MEIKLKILIKIILSILFVVCWFPLPYGYFQIVRFAGMASFIWFAFLDSRNNYKSLALFWAFSAILINPFFKVSLGRTIWNIVDIIWALILLATLVSDFRQLKKSDT